MGEYLKRFQSAADYTAHINNAETSPLNVSICDDNNEMHYMEQGNSSKIAPSIDSNIIPGNIKKDVTILGVTGTYEGEGGGNATVFYPCISTPPTRAGVRRHEPEPGTYVTFYVQYPNNNDKIPDMFIFYDYVKLITNTRFNYGVISQDKTFISDYDYGGAGNLSISVTNVTSTLLTLQFSSPLTGVQFDITKFQFAPIYLS